MSDFNFLWGVIVKLNERLYWTRHRSKLFTCIYLCNSYNNLCSSYYYHNYLTNTEIPQGHTASKKVSNPGNLASDLPALKECLLMAIMKTLVTVGNMCFAKILLYIIEATRGEHCRVPYIFSCLNKPHKVFLKKVEA